MARERNEDYLIKKEALNEAQGHIYQAVNEVMPKASFVITRQEQDVGKDSSSTSEVGSSFSRRTTPQKKFVFSQPIFSGFKEFAALEGSGAEMRQKVHEMRRSEELLFMDVMDAFYSLAESRKDLEILEVTRKLLEERIKELEARATLGRSRDSEVQSAIADLKVLESELEDERGTERLAVQLLEYYTGQSLEVPLSDEKDLKNEVVEVANFLIKSKKRSDVLAAENAKTLAEKNVVVAQSGLFPKVTLDGNYYTERVGFQSGIDWDVLLTIDIPIFEGTQVIGDIKEAASLRKQAELEFAKSKRLANLEIRNAFETLKASRLEEKALEEAVAASRKNYEIYVEEYRLNLVNNLDVLDALRRLQDIEQRLNAILVMIWNSGRFAKMAVKMLFCLQKATTSVG